VSDCRFNTSWQKSCVRLLNSQNPCLGAPDLLTPVSPPAIPMRTCPWERTFGGADTRATNQNAQYPLGYVVPSEIPT
jgi:hypothetical protein